MLKVENLCKNYPSFSLKNVSFELKNGCITGFVGQNGAGKTTTLKCIMRQVLPSGGKVILCGKDFEKNERELKRKISFSNGTFEYFPMKKLCDVADCYKVFYDNFNQKIFNEYCEKFNLDLNKKVRELSAGMKVKFSLALALSHEAEVFIFDEPTSGLDPIAREEVTDVFRDVVSDGEKSVLFSTHITEDLDKCADYILFISDGEIIVDREKDELLDSLYLLSGDLSVLNAESEPLFVSVKPNAFGFKGLITRENFKKLKQSDGGHANLIAEKPTIDDVIIYYTRAKKYGAKYGDKK